MCIYTYVYIYMNFVWLKLNRYRRLHFFWDSQFDAIAPLLAAWKTDETTTILCPVLLPSGQAAVRTAQPAQNRMYAGDWVTGCHCHPKPRFAPGDCHSKAPIVNILASHLFFSFLGICRASVDIPRDPEKIPGRHQVATFWTCRPECLQQCNKTQNGDEMDTTRFPCHLFRHA